MSSEIRMFPEFHFADRERSLNVVNEILDKLMISKGFLPRLSLTVLYELALGLHGGIDGYIVECGTFTGVSASVMACGLRESGSNFKPVVTIDSYSWRPAALSVAFFDTYPALGLFPEYICPVLSEDVPFFERFWCSDIRLLFLDSDHSHEHVKMQLEMCVPYVIGGGWIAIDDYGHIGMTDAVNEWLDAHDFEPFYAAENVVGAVYVKNRSEE